MVEGQGVSVFFAAGARGVRLSARGVTTLRSFLREHGAGCLRQFMQVILASSSSDICRSHIKTNQQMALITYADSLIATQERMRVLHRASNISSSTNFI